MVGVKKIVADRTNETVISQLRDTGYDHIVLYYNTHPKHQKAGLATDKMLVYAWRYQPRLDRRNKKVGELMKKRKKRNGVVIVANQTNKCLCCGKKLDNEKPCEYVTRLALQTKEQLAEYGLTEPDFSDCQTLCPKGYNEQPNQHCCLPKEETWTEQDAKMRKLSCSGSQEDIHHILGDDRNSVF